MRIKDEPQRDPGAPPHQPKPAPRYLEQEVGGVVWE